MWIRLVVAALGLALSGPVAAQSPAPSAPTPTSQDTAPASQEPTRVDDIVVDGRLDALALEFVGSLAAPARERGLARWEREVCLGAVNFRGDVAHQLVDHISDVARDIGVELGEPGCSPNVLIIGTTDGRALATELVRRQRRQFRYGYTQSNRGGRALEVFQTSDAPIRWWHISLPYNVETGEVAIRLPGRGPVDWPCPVNRGRRFCNAVTDRLIRSLIIVDVEALPDVGFVQLADYLSVLTLAQVEPDSDYAAFDTVLKVLQEPQEVAGLTEWDRNYLRALYSGGSQRLDPREQAAALADRMRAGQD